MASEPIDWFLEQAAAAYQAEVAVVQTIRERISFVSSILLTPVLGISLTAIFGYHGSCFRCLAFWAFIIPGTISIVLTIWATFILVRELARKSEYAFPLRPAELFKYFKEGTNADESLHDTKSG